MWERTAVWQLRSRLSLHTFIQHSNQAIPPQLHIAPYIVPPFPLLLVLYSSHNVFHLQLLSRVPHLLIPEPVCHSTVPSYLSLNSFHPVYHSAVPPYLSFNSFHPVTPQSHLICHSTVSTLSLPSPMHPICHCTVSTLFVTPLLHPCLSLLSFRPSVTPQLPPCLSCHSPTMSFT